MKLKALLVFLAFLLASCRQEDVKLIVFTKKAGSANLSINGKPLKAYDFQKADLYEANYRIYDSAVTSVELTNGTEIIVNEALQPGTYLVNLDEGPRLTFEEISYDRYCTPCSKGEVVGLGITKMAADTLALPYKFNETPPTEIRTKSADSLSARQFFQLKTLSK